MTTATLGNRWIADTGIDREPVAAISRLRNPASDRLDPAQIRHDGRANLISEPTGFETGTALITLPGQLADSVWGTKRFLSNWAPILFATAFVLIAFLLLSVLSPSQEAALRDFLRLLFE